MGYDTSYNLSVCGVSGDEEEQIYREIADAAGEPLENVESFGFTGHWYDSDDDLKRIAARHPEAIIEVSGNGEAPDDIWCARYKGRRCETVRYNGLPDFKDVLTPEEEERVFGEAYDRYLAARKEMLAAAARRIRAVKARITGREDCHLVLDRENWFVISAKSPVTDEPLRVTVTGINDDGERVTTSDDPVLLDEMEEGDVKALVTALENIEKDIREGRLAGRYDEEDDWFILDESEEGTRRERLIKNILAAIRDHFEGLDEDDAPESYPLAVGPGLDVKAVDGLEDVPEGWSYEEITDLEDETIADLADRILCE